MGHDQRNVQVELPPYVHVGVIIFVAGLFAVSSGAPASPSNEHLPLASCLQHVKAKPPSLQTRLRPRMQFTHLSQSGDFRIHYDTVGLNAVPTFDYDRNGIPDFVDSVAFYMDAALRFATDSLGYRRPPRDYVDTSSWDVYLVQLGKVPGFYFDDRDLGQFGWYGATYAEDLLPLPCGGYAATGFIFLDNDYSSKDSIGSTVRRATYSDTGFVALKITCYHEFHHLVQYGYYYGASPAYYEMTSVWIEQRAFPTITNYVQYVRRLFANPTLYCLSCDRNIEGSYGYSIAVRYLALQLGDSIVRNWWEGIGRCSAPPVALDSVISARGANFHSLWCQMMPWLYWTGARSRSGYFADASLLPELQPDNSPDDQMYTWPSWMRTISLYPLQFKLLRVLLPAEIPERTPDTVDFVVTNPAIRSLAADPRSSADYSVSIHQTAEGIQLGGTRYYAVRRGDNTCDFIAVQGGYATAVLREPVPHPVARSRNTEVLLPVPPDASPGENAEVSMLTSQGVEVYRTSAPVEVLSTNYRCVRLSTGSSNFPSPGIYIVTVRVGEAALLTKLAIVP